MSRDRKGIINIINPKEGRKQQQQQKQTKQRKIRQEKNIYKRKTKKFCMIDLNLVY